MDFYLTPLYFRMKQNEALLQILEEVAKLIEEQEEDEQQNPEAV